jgi:hypothetical protein
MTEHPLVITRLRRDEQGAWAARVNLNGTGVNVSRRFGSWLAFGDEQEHRAERFEGIRDVLHPVAARLQEKARRAEKKEAKV